MMTAIDPVLAAANEEQLAASDPATSAFVAASAGSGKTKLLTDRLLRLMLAGTGPEKILCLTYTKAAAAEMAIRLNRRLGAWVVMPEVRLDAELAALAVTPTAKTRVAARKLFADVLDLPGGMRIETIHAFCQSLLRRFPLEAGLSPHFQLADDANAASRLRESREVALANPHLREAIALLAAETNEQAFAELTAKFAAGRNDVQALFKDFGAAGVAAMQRGVLAAGDEDEAEILHKAVGWEREIPLAQALRRIADAGNPSGRVWALDRLDWLAKYAADRIADWPGWVSGHFTADGPPRKLGNFYGKALAGERDAIQQEIDAEHRRIRAVENQRKAVRLAALNAALATVLEPILDADATSKTATAVLSYADLITRTGRLLFDPGAAWVLYKLDGGIDHLLLDEVQDTAPSQWNIADAIAAEFFAGAGANEAKRTIFAVGDPKQSIFSFQGADLQSFATYRRKFRDKVKHSGNAWLDGTLSVSFRSSAPVLELVDAVFKDGPACAGVTRPGTMKHGVSRAGQAGRVTLWPLAEPGVAPELPAWAMPEDYAGADSAKALLARQIAVHIKSRLDAKEFLPSRDRAISAGDFLILVRQRDELVTAITRAAKALGIPIAGLDRMVLTRQQAVSDMLALCDAILLPEDDLAFAQFLASPLGGLSDAEIMSLAIGRRGTLSAALYAARAKFPLAHDFFETLRNRVDYITPHALLAEVLGPLGGRAKLLARLGPEAAEPLDELLAEALAFGKQAPGALQTFLHHLRTTGADIKREADAGGDVVRVMTVHGAKGLQAPVVILPDTTSIPKNNETLFWLTPPQQDTLVPVYCPRAELRPDAVTDAHAAAREAAEAEYNRLLYVALTRAEDELIICGAAPKKKIPENAWYKSIQAGFARLPAVEMDGILSHAATQTAAPDRKSQLAAAPTAVLPAWAGAAPDWRAVPPSAETTRPEPLAPSRSTDEDTKRAIAASPLGDGLAATRAGREAALAKGRAVHALLQHLPDLPPGGRLLAARKFLATVPELDAPGRAGITTAVFAVLDNPDLAPLFGPGSRAETPLAGVVGDVEIGGLVDRLAVTPDRILIADYKTDRVPPANAAEIPAGYLRQLSAYRAILAQIHPGRAIDCLLIFTATAAVLPVPPGLLDRHAPGDATPA